VKVTVAVGDQPPPKPTFPQKDRTGVKPERECYAGPTLIFRQAIQAIFRLIGASSPKPNPSLLSLLVLLLMSSRTTELSLLRPPRLEVSRLRSILALLLLLLLLWVYRLCPLIFASPLPRSGSSFRCKFSCGDRETELGPEMGWLMVPVAVLPL
jgi:hypothetical protein